MILFAKDSVALT